MSIPSHTRSPWARWTWAAGALALALGMVASAAELAPATSTSIFPLPLESYPDEHLGGVGAILRQRIAVEPMNLWASLLFGAAILHTFLAQRIRHLAHVMDERKAARLRAEGIEVPATEGISKFGRLLHFLGEVEAIFGIWAVPLALLISARFGPRVASAYLNHRVNYSEAIFVVVIMAMSLTRPVLGLAEAGMRRLARLGGGQPLAWWLTILIVGPLLGSFITEPAAMAISASLLAAQFYALKPRGTLAYATLGLLFVNVSIGGTLTHFAAPPVLMVAGPWQWDTPYMMAHFGWRAAVAIVIASAGVAFWFRRDFAQLREAARQFPATAPAAGGEQAPVPFWVTATHLAFLGFAVVNAHNPAVLLGSFLFFLAFAEVTQDYQGDMQLRSPILVGFFLAGLVIHGGLQQWWIEPVLGSLREIPLFFGAMTLTAFNDNAAITYLATLVPGLSEVAKNAVVMGAVAGGGLTVIANAPNPAGQSILARYFPEGISPLGLLLGALAPTGVAVACFLLLR